MTYNFTLRGKIKMLKNKKLMALLLGGIIGTSSILAGCGSGGNTSSSGGEGE